MSNNSLKDAILNSSTPLVIKNILNWSQLKWNLIDWRNNLHDPNKKYPFRRGTFKCSNIPQWERLCDIINLSMEEFFALMNDEGKNPDKWLYFDYKHLEHWFNHNISLKDISWACIGLPEVRSSTIWIGTAGAHTPCHYDSYGHNVVAQLYGKKMWILFPPHMINELKPSRIPYEESSIYSELNFFCGCSDLSAVSKAWLVILEPGDILYVPTHWWHYVENITPAISINSWLPLESDSINRFEESLAKCFVSSFIKDLPEEEKLSLLNPNEDDLPASINLSELTFCWEQCDTLMKENKPDVYIKNSNCNNSNVKPVEEISGDRLRSMLSSKCSGSPAEIKKPFRSVQVKDIINSFCHPEVLALVRLKLQETLESYKT